MAKSERFEMRVDEEILARVDRWRGKQDDLPSRAEAMRRLVEIGLVRLTGETVKFSDGEKLLAMMMKDLYKHHKVKGDIDADFVGEVIWGGHYWAPKWEMPGLFHDHEDSPSEVALVMDVLEMWDSLERAHEKLGTKEKERVDKEAHPFGKTVRFRGFDGNNESSRLSIARFLIEKMDRFEKFKGRDLNSHAPSLGTYDRMLKEFEPMRANLMGTGLNATQVIRILKAQKHEG